MVSVLDSGLSGLGLSLGWGLQHCVLRQGIVLSFSAHLHPGV